MLSCIITWHLVAALRGTAKFKSGYHALMMREGREEIQWQHVEAVETALGESQDAISKLEY